MRSDCTINVKGLLTALLFFMSIWTVALYAKAPEDSYQIVWKLIQVKPDNDNSRNILAAGGFEFKPGLEKTGLEVIATGDQINWIKNKGLDVNILVENYGKFIEQRNKEITRLAAVDDFATGSMGGYYNPDEVLNFLDSLISIDRFGIISDTFHIGYSWEGKPLWMVSVSGNQDDESLPEVLYNSLIHAREGMSLMTLLYYMRYLVENYGVVDSVTEVVDNRKLYFLPIFNPDGYDFNWNYYKSNKGFGYWRKNYKSVDLNRNFSYMWGFDNLGSSYSSNEEDYRGSYAFSEPETQAVRDFIRSHQFITALDMHSYSDVLINPFSYANQHTPDSLLYKHAGAMMTAVNGYGYGTSYSLIGYVTNGDLMDWEYADSTKNKIFSWSIEIGTRYDDFWPPATRITPLAKENLHLMFTQAKISGFWPEIESVEQAQANGDSTLIKVFFTLSNQGLEGNRDQLSVRLIEPGKGVSLVNSTVLLENIPAEEGQQLSSVRDSLSLRLREYVYSSTVALAVYDGERKVRRVELNVQRLDEPEWDVNRDGTANIFDLLDLLKVITSGDTMTLETARYDLTKDGQINIFDLLAFIINL